MENTASPKDNVDSWNPLHQGALHRAEELSDDVLAAIEGTF